MRGVLAGLLLTLVAPSWVVAQTAAGPEFRLNSFTTGAQWDASVASDGTGAFVAVWNSASGQDGSGYGVFGQSFAADGTPRGGEFAVNTYTTGNQASAVVAAGANGSFVVAWSSPQDGSSFGVFARRFDASGTPLGPEFQVNTFTGGAQTSPAVAAGPGGSFVVVWTSESQDGSIAAVAGQRFSGAGTPIGGEFRANTYTPGFQGLPSIGFGAAGSFVVVWEDRSQDGDIAGIFGQRFDASAAAVGAEFRVNTYTALNQMVPSMAVDENGFVVTWESFNQDGSAAGVFGQRFDAAGARLGAEFRVNTYTTNEQREPSVARYGDGSFVVTWHSYPQDGSNWGVFGQRFDGSGLRVGAEFRVNSYTAGDQSETRVASDTAGNFVVAWHSTGQDPLIGVFGQRFGGLLPAALDVDTGRNHVFEPGESVDVRPTWRNVNGATQTFAGGLSSFTGPPGATYAVTDGAGDYGAVANGSEGPCTDCYGVSVSNPAVRPAAHWDASALESITPAAQGQQKVWRLHVGRSFSDVAHTSVYYRFVETLLHHSVTGGCGAGTYCPGSSTTREQMAVFVLVSKEGAGYAPPACATPLFTDVPASSGFCRWIEELARRGVVSGCGGGAYCPAAPVTREQMAVFVLRTLDPALDPPACGTPVFNDVPASSVFCRWIEELARRGVVSGCGGGNYCPADAVTREQMGVFLGVTFGLTLYGV